MSEWKKSSMFENSPCDPMKCNPKCPRCGDTPSCGDGSWSWGHGKYLHRCRDAHPQSGHDEVLCNTHDGPFIIDRLTRENAEKNLADAERRLALAVAEVKAWRVRYASKCPADAGTLEHTAYYTAAAKSLAAARAATNADLVLSKMIGGE